MDPRSKAEFDLAMTQFRKDIGQEPEPDLLMVQRLQAYYASAAPFSISPTRPHLGYHSALLSPGSSYHTPAAARAMLGLQSAAYATTWTEPSRWDRLKGTFFVRLRDFRRWLGSKIAGCDCEW